MKRILQDLIYSDQTGFLKNRYIGENVRKILDIIDICDEDHIPAIPAELDFEKAFDRFRRKFFQSWLEYFNFGLVLYNSGPIYIYILKVLRH